VHTRCKELKKAFETAIWDEKAEKQGELKRLDNGTTDIDSLDSFEYAIIPYKSKIVKGA
jgi:hypothetical protein